MLNALSSTFTWHGKFLLAGGNDIDVDWAIVCSNGLPIEYFQFRKLPRSKRQKILEIAKLVAKNKFSESIETMALAIGYGLTGKKPQIN